MNNKGLDDVDKAIVGLIVGGVLVAGGVGWAAGYDAGYASGRKEVKPPVYVYGNQDNSIRINSSN